MAYTIDRVVADSSQALTNASETTIYSLSIPANTLRTNQMVRVKLNGSILNNSGANQVYTFRAKYGATTLIAEALVTLPFSATLRGFHLWLELWGDNSTSAQYMAAEVAVTAITAVTTGLTGDFGAANFLPPSTLSGTSAIDSTAAQTLAVTLQSAAATATQNFTTRTVIAEVV